MGSRRSKLDDSIVGQTHGRYKILSFFKKDRRSYFEVVCSEGHLLSCVRADYFFKSSNICSACYIYNEQYKSRTYNSWDAMIQRCTNENNRTYPRYGGIGISVYDDWLLPGGLGWKNFYAYMGDCPDGMTLDRYPNKFGNYEPGNVRWATNSEQGYNQKRRSTNTSGRTGVSWNKEKSKWVAAITYNNKVINLGYSDSFEGAVSLREEAELKYFGETKE